MPCPWFKGSERARKRLLPGRFLPPDARVLEVLQSSLFKNEANMSRHLPDKVGDVRLLKGAPLSVLMVMAIVDCTLKVHQPSSLTGYEPDEVVVALEKLYEYRFVQMDNIHGGWVLSSLYALVLFEDERDQRRN